MDVLDSRCCGVDVQKKQVVACLLTPGPAGAPRKAIRTCGTTTAELLRLVDWLQAAGGGVYARGQGSDWGVLETPLQSV